MSKIHLALLTSIFVLHSCKPSHPLQSANADCSGFKNFIRENWRYNSEKKLYERSTELKGSFAGVYSKFKFEHCILLLDTNQLVKIFGPPSTKTSHSFLYFIDPNGKETSYEFTFNYQGKIESWLINYKTLDTGF